MLANANAIIAHLDSTRVDTPVQLPAHGDIGDEPCVQFHFERRRGRFVECLVAMSGVYVVIHENGRPGRVHRCKRVTPHVVADLISGCA